MTTPELKSAHEWLKDPRVQTEPGRILEIADPDGWRRSDDIWLDVPITFEDFQERLGACTVRSHPIEKSAKNWLRDPTTQVHRGKMVNIVNPAGWLLGDGITMHTPITLENFYVRLAKCTLDGYVDAEPPLDPITS